MISLVGALFSRKMEEWIWGRVGPGGVEGGGNNSWDALYERVRRKKKKILMAHSKKMTSF